MATKTSITATQMTAFRLVEAFASVQFEDADFKTRSYFAVGAENGLDTLVPCEPDEANRLVVIVIGWAKDQKPCRRQAFAVHFKVTNGPVTGHEVQLVRVVEPSEDF